MNQKLISLNAVRTALVRLTGLALLAFSVSAMAAPYAPTLKDPYDGKTNVTQGYYNDYYGVYLTWSFTGTPSGTPNYRLVVSQNSAFSGFVDNGGSSSCDSSCWTNTESLYNAYYTKSLSCTGHKYYWKVRVNNNSGVSGWSVTRSFTTSGSSDSCPSVSPLAAKVDAFVNTWNGRGTDFDGAYGYQCVDLMRRYAQDVLGLSNGGKSELASGIDKSAYSIFTNASSSRFTRIYNSLTAVPQKGDIIFWNKSSSNGNYGHVAIFIQGDARIFTSIDQNWGAGANIITGLPAKIVSHDYTSSGGVVGWLRLK